MARIITGSFPNIVRKGYSTVWNPSSILTVVEFEEAVREHHGIPPEAKCSSRPYFHGGSTSMDFRWLEVTFNE